MHFRRHRISDRHCFQVNPQKYVTTNELVMIKIVYIVGPHPSSGIKSAAIRVQTMRLKMLLTLLDVMSVCSSDK